MAFAVRRTRRPTDPQWSKFFSDEEKAEARQQEILLTSLADTELTVRTVNNLETCGIALVQDLARKEREDLLGIENFGEKTIAECAQVLDALGVTHPNWKPPRKEAPKRKKRKGKKSRRARRKPASPMEILLGLVRPKRFRR